MWDGTGIVMEIVCWLICFKNRAVDLEHWDGDGNVFYHSTWTHVAIPSLLAELPGSQNWDLGAWIQDLRFCWRLHPCGCRDCYMNYCTDLRVWTPCMQLQPIMQVSQTYHQHLAAATNPWSRAAEDGWQGSPSPLRQHRKPSSRDYWGWRTERTPWKWHNYPKEKN